MYNIVLYSHCVSEKIIIIMMMKEIAVDLEFSETYQFLLSDPWTKPGLNQNRS